MANNYTKKTNFEYIQGKLKWVKAVKPDLTYNCWQATVYPIPSDLEKVREWQGKGLKNQVKKDEDGWFVKFRCDVTKERKDGSIWAFEPPRIVDRDGKPMDGSAIGDGSDGTVKLEVYEHGTPGGGKSIAARFVGLRIDNLVPLSEETGMSDEELAEAGGYKELQPLF